MKGIPSSGEELLEEICFPGGNLAMRGEVSRWDEKCVKKMIS